MFENIASDAILMLILLFLITLAVIVIDALICDNDVRHLKSS